MSTTYNFTVRVTDTNGTAESVADSINVTNVEYWTPIMANYPAYAWFVSDDAQNTVNGSNQYTAWFDLTGNGHHGQAQKSFGTPAINKSTWSNGREVASIGGGNTASTFLLDNSVGFLRNKTGATVAMVYYAPTYVGEGTRGLFACYTNTGNPRLFLSPSQPSGGVNSPHIKGRRLDADSESSITSGSARIGEHLIIASIDYANSNASIYSAYGLDASTATWSTDGSSSDTDANAGVRLGKHGDGGTGQSGLGGYIAEVVMWDSVISDDDRQKLEGYLAWKWDLVSQLPANHPYKNDPPTAW